MKVHVIYFTCSDHFSELKASIKSLLNLSLTNLGKIYIYCDFWDYFSKDEEIILKGYGCIIRKTIERLSWGGIKTVECELYSFGEVLKDEGISGDDYIVNIDSDLIFISDKIFKDVESCGNFDLIGNPVDLYFEASWDKSLRSESTRFHQGSCYFLKADFIPKMLRVYGEKRDSIIASIKGLCFVDGKTIPPDVSINLLVNLSGGNIKYINFFVSDQSVIHLELTKDKRWASFIKTLGIEKTGHHVLNDTYLIPKIIHYCWYGGEKPDIVKRCIDSWHKFLPDYRIVEWNESNTKSYGSIYIDKLLKLLQGNTDSKKYFSNLSDYMRLRVLYEYGGIYLDADVEVLRSMDNFLKNRTFLGMQFPSIPIGTGSYKEMINGAIMGSIKGQAILKALMNIKDKHFDGDELPNIAGPRLITEYLIHCGMDYSKDIGGNIIKVDDITLYPSFYFYPYSFNEVFDGNKGLDKDLSESYCIHHWMGSWMGIDGRGQI